MVGFGSSISQPTLFCASWMSSAWFCRTVGKLFPPSSSLELQVTACSGHIDRKTVSSPAKSSRGLGQHDPWTSATGTSRSSLQRGCSTVWKEIGTSNCRAHSPGLPNLGGWPGRAVMTALSATSCGSLPVCCTEHLVHRALFYPYVFCRAG